ncbi:MAG TPA: hypothetical protein VMU84_07190 [Thermoanaerobaculia bacterium]|nr:hypothetical protein [Thermoanaerobaculia bacterium]
MKYALAAFLFIAALPMGAATIRNDDSCDISVAPAATLLLPYFEADLEADRAHALDTMFTIANVSHATRIAHVTLWTDLAYPIYAFDLVLTPYDVQAISMRDLLQTGSIARPAPGPRTPSSCLELPSSIPPQALAVVRAALTHGIIDHCSNEAIGLEHSFAIGYATIDVVGACTSRLPAEPSYYTEDLRFDNVLIGDWVMLSPNPVTGNYAAGSPLVHIRAIPAGFPAGAPTHLPRTFYEIHTPESTPHIDRRQPLPAAFAARYIEGGASGFDSQFIVWRQSTAGRSPTCAQYRKNDAETQEVVRFDSRENAFIRLFWGGCTCPLPSWKQPITSRTKSSNTSVYPALTSGDTSGWMYINATEPTTTPQTWVVATMFAEGRFSVAFDAVALGNGCSARPDLPATIGPAQ